MIDDTWIALDFETATAERHSACALGIAVIDDGVVTGGAHWLIQPPGNHYDERNIWVHGISGDHTEAAPTFDELWGELRPLLDGHRIIAHWASFDVSVLRATLAHYGLAVPDALYTCSCRMSQRAFPSLPNHRLPTMCDHCGIPLQHHDAASDALACAHVALQCRNAVGAGTIAEAIDLLGVRLAPL